MTLNNIVTLKSRLKVTQGHWKWHHSKAWVRFPILPRCENNLRMCLAVSTEYRRVTNRQTDGQISCHSIVHTRRAVKMILVQKRRVSVEIYLWMARCLMDSSRCTVAARRQSFNGDYVTSSDDVI